MKEKQWSSRFFSGSPDIQEPSSTSFSSALFLEQWNEWEINYLEWIKCMVYKITQWAGVLMV